MEAPAALGCGVDGVDRVGSDDGGIGTEPEVAAGDETGIDQVAQGEDAVEAVGELPLKHIDVGEEVAGLDAAGDAERGEARDVGGVDEFGVFNAEERDHGIEGSWDRVDRT